jgi:hypothetical protein
MGFFIPMMEKLDLEAQTQTKDSRFLGKYYE